LIFVDNEQYCTKWVAIFGARISDGDKDDDEMRLTEMVDNGITKLNKT